MDISISDNFYTAGMPAYAKPVSDKCFMASAKNNDIPVSFLLAIWEVENGNIGTIHRNSNSIDVGPLQINTVNWSNIEQALGYTPNELLWDACANIDAAGYLIKKHFMSRDQSLNGWEEVLTVLANYHSKTPNINKVYQQKLAGPLANYLEMELGNNE